MRGCNKTLMKCESIAEIGEVLHQNMNVLSLTCGPGGTNTQKGSSLNFLCKSLGMLTWHRFKSRPEHQTKLLRALITNGESICPGGLG